MESIARGLIVAGVAILLAGFLLLGGAKLGLGKLPGDFSFGTRGFRVFLPIGTSIVISVILTVVLNLIFRSR